MSFSDFMNTEFVPAFRQSIEESRASGLAVARMNIPVGFATSGEQIAAAFVDMGADIGVVRFPSEMSWIPHQLVEAGVASWQADTLLYFAADLIPLDEESSHLVLREPKSQSEIVDLVAQTFRDYPNHYRSSPALSSIDIVAAYTDWSLRQWNSVDSRIYIAGDSGRTAWGIAVTTAAADFGTEILLAGVIPDMRGRGNYSALLRAVLERTSREGGRRVYISTQTTNIRVMMSWCRLGLLPVLSVNTAHIYSPALATRSRNGSEPNID